MSDSADPEAAAIEALAQDYFLGMYEGDVERLRRIFNPQCWLFGENRSGHHEFPLSGFLDQIGSEPAPKTVGEPFDMRLVSFDRTASIAMVKVEVRYQNRQYTDYLMLQMTADGWRIVSKAFFCPDQ
jgi:Putative lumazine-binding